MFFNLKRNIAPCKTFDREIFKAFLNQLNNRFFLPRTLLSSDQKNFIVILLVCFLNDGEFNTNKMTVISYFKQTWKVSIESNVLTEEHWNSFQSLDDMVKVGIVLVIHCVLFIDGNPSKQQVNFATNFLKNLNIDKVFYIHIINSYNSICEFKEFKYIFENSVFK